MPGKETALHWHGVFLKGQPYMDGVPMITQCSIHEGETFRYDFYADNAGTFFWHSHDGWSVVPIHLGLCVYLQ
jgi:FtsP/CotA-like multicopper oxidase with cupredoxin domain